MPLSTQLRVDKGKLPKAPHNFFGLYFLAKSEFWKDDRKVIIKYMLNYDSQYIADIP